MEEAERRIAQAVESEWELSREVEELKQELEAKEEEEKVIAARQDAIETEIAEVKELQEELLEKEKLLFQCKREVTELQRKQREEELSREQERRQHQQDQVRLNAQLQVNLEREQELEMQLANHSLTAEAKEQQRKARLHNMYQAIGKCGIVFVLKLFALRFKGLEAEANDKEQLLRDLKELETKDAAAVEYIEKLQKQLKAVNSVVKGKQIRIESTRNMILYAYYY